MQWTAEITLALSFAASAIGLLSVSLISRNKVSGWYVGVVGLIPSALLALVTGAYFNLFACSAYAALYIASIRDHFVRRAGMPIHGQQSLDDSSQPAPSAAREQREDVK